MYVKFDDVCPDCQYIEKCKTFVPIEKYCDKCNIFLLRSKPEDIFYCEHCLYFFEWEYF